MRRFLAIADRQQSHAQTQLHTKLGLGSFFLEAPTGSPIDYCMCFV
jgi:hypothetical protein